MRPYVGQSEEPVAAVRCPICAEPNSDERHCRHVRWTFDQGGPLDFANFAVETSPYVRARGHSSREIGSKWMQEHGDWIVERVLTRFEAADGFVFGEVSQVDMLARDIWTEFHPEPERPRMERLDPV